MKKLVGIMLAICLLSVSAYAVSEVYLEDGRRIVSDRRITTSPYEGGTISCMRGDEVLWSIYTGEHVMAMVSTISDVYVDDNTAYFTAGGELKAVDVNTGEVKWIAKSPGSGIDMKIDDFGNIYVAAYDGNGLKVYNKDGVLLYEDDTNKAGPICELDIYGNTLYAYYDTDLSNLYPNGVRTIGTEQFKPVDVMVNGEALASDMQSFIRDERALVPLRAIFEALGATVAWNPDTQTVSAVRGDTEISLTIDSCDLYVNGEGRRIDVPAQIEGERTFVPVRAISEAFGCNVDWDETAWKVIITE